MTILQKSNETAVHIFLKIGPPVIYKTHCIIYSSETMIFNSIYQRGNLQSHLITVSYYKEALLWLSNWITVKAWHPVCQLRFFRGRCKTQHNTCPLTEQYYTTMEKYLPRLVVPSLWLAYFFCISLQAMQIFTWFYFPKQMLQLFS